MRSFCLVVVLASPVPALARSANAGSSPTPSVARTGRANSGHGTRIARPVAARPSRLPVAEPIATPWSQFRDPTSALPQAIGGYSDGCIDGAVPLPLAGDGFQVVRPERNRVFGHPDLIDMIRELGAQLARLELPALSIGDLGQPRGGPTPSGHASDSRVERIFVNPVLKRAACERSVGRDRTWLRKLRPWYGHDDHFHVRIACPADSPTCIAQLPLAPGDGCDQLSAWLPPKGARRRSRTRLASVTRTTPPADAPERSLPPDMPGDCRALLDPSPPSFSGSALAARRAERP